jgi:hypothetical protein
VHIADATFFARIAPGPAEAVVEECEWFSGAKGADHLRVIVRLGSQGRLSRDRSLDRLSIMRSNQARREREVREIISVGVKTRVREIGRAGEYELVSAGGRRPALGR